MVACAGLAGVQGLQGQDAPLSPRELATCCWREEHVVGHPRGQPGLETHGGLPGQSCKFTALAWDAEVEGVGGLPATGSPVCPGALLGPTSWALS